MMNLTSPGKLVVLIVCLIGAFVSLALGVLDQTVFVAIVGPIVGYVVGNGVGARRGMPQAPLFAPTAAAVAAHIDPPAATV